MQVSKNTSSAKQKNISETTKRMLLKGKALGNANIASEDRLYLQVSSSCLALTGSHIQSSGQVVPRTECVYVSVHKTVAEAIHDIQLLLPSLTGSKGNPNLTYSFLYSKLKKINSIASCFFVLYFDV